MTNPDTPPVSDLDELLRDVPVAPPSLAGAAGKPAKCKGRHLWGGELKPPDAAETAAPQPYGPDPTLRIYVKCVRCGHPRDPARSRRGKSSRRLGSDQERRAERVYGWEKIGERGQMTDLRGKMFKVQMKASRRAAPALFRAVFPALDASRDGRIPLILLSFVKAGVGTDDYVVIRGRDWLDLHGRDEAAE